MKKLTFVLMVILGLNPVFGQDSTSMEDIRKVLSQDSIMKSFHYLSGRVIIGDKLATVDVPPGCVFLETAEARVLLEDIYGNMPNPGCLGVLLSDTPDIYTGCTWIVDYGYNGDGHVEDDDAKDIDYDDLLKQMKEEIDAGNPERIKLGYESAQLFGWAKKPFYDPINKKLHWAKDISFGGAAEHTLNYSIRVLGREGFLEMNIISAMAELPAVEKDVDKILKSTNFIEGAKYADYNSNTDKLAEYGIGGLIVGGILAKTGFFAKIGLFLLKFIKPLIIGIVALFGFIGKKFFGKKDKDMEPAVKDLPEQE